MYGDLLEQTVPFLSLWDGVWWRKRPLSFVLFKNCSHDLIEERNLLESSG